MSETKSFYENVRKAVEKNSAPAKTREIRLGEFVRNLRLSRKISGVEFCRRTGGMDPKTLTAIEMGRIQNPTIRTLQYLARGFEFTVGDLFRMAEMEKSDAYHVGSQKGCFEFRLPDSGVRWISYTPFVKELFCGKVAFPPGALLESGKTRESFCVFVLVLLGTLEISVLGKKSVLKEGQNIFFNASFGHRLSNPGRREAVCSFVTSPSFIVF